VIERTRLLRHYNDDGYANRAKVDLVGHSMGGLLIAGVLQRRGPAARIGKVATLATPFRGSFEAVIKVVTGTADLGTPAPSSREREAARATPALYQLFPSFPDGLQVPEGLEPSLFNPAVWQPSIVATIRDYILKYGLNPAAADAQAPQLLATLLQQAREHRSRLENLDLAQAGLTKADWLCIVGVNSETRVRMRITATGGVPAFVLTSSDRVNAWSRTNEAERTLTGDGTVPFDGARPGFLDLENLVCVAPEDFGYWEVGDRALAAVAGFHGIMPNMDLLHRLIVLHFTGRPISYDNVWGRRPPGVINWAPPIAGLPPR
jgi:pimeloyl-ACP methyl ester carboxylesterase